MLPMILNPIALNPIAFPPAGTEMIEAPERRGADDLFLLSAPEAAVPPDVLALLLSDKRSPATRRAYARDLAHFFGCGASASPEPLVVQAFLCLPAPALVLRLHSYKAGLLERGLSEATVNRRLSAVRSLIRMARRLGADAPDPTGLVGSEKQQPYRDTRGPALGDVKRLLAAPNRETSRGKRDFALLLLLWENALRRAEVCACDAADFDAGERRLFIQGKGQGTQKAPVTLSDRAVAALQAYLDTRPLIPGSPLFASLARFAAPESRLTPDGLHDLVDRLGKKALGRPLHPHALRHAAITAVLDATGGDVRTAQRLSRHADIRTLARYDDNREDLQGKATQLLSALT